MADAAPGNHFLYFFPNHKRAAEGPLYSNNEEKAKRFSGQSVPYLITLYVTVMTYTCTHIYMFANRQPGTCTDGADTRKHTHEAHPIQRQAALLAGQERATKTAPCAARTSGLRRERGRKAAPALGRSGAQGHGQ